MEHIVIFMNYNGKKLYETRVSSGSTAVYEGPIPRKEGESFLGWNKSLENITDDLIVTAVFEKQKSGTLKLGAIAFEKNEEKSIDVIDNVTITNEDLRKDIETELDR